MNFQLLFPYILAIIRHILVGAGAVGASEAEDTSTKLASAVVIAAGLAWSFYEKKQKQKQPPATPSP